MLTFRRYGEEIQTKTPFGWVENSTHFARECVYNGLDATITAEIWPCLEASLKEEGDPSNKDDISTWKSYCLSFMNQLPFLEMMRRGMRLDRNRTKEVIDELTVKYEFYNNRIQQMVQAAGFDSLNPMSNARTGKSAYFFFYEFIGLQPIKKFDQKTKKMVPSLDKKSILKLRSKHNEWACLINHILAVRGIKKSLEVLEEALKNERMYYSLHVTGTTTYRISSTANYKDQGTNIQNINKKLRDMFIPDEGYVIGYADEKRAESVVVAHLSEDENFLKAVESNVHTYVARMVWPGLPWEGDDAKDTEIAKKLILEGHMSYYDIAKRCGHGTNYMMQARTMESNTGVPYRICCEFIELYLHQAFPGIRLWQKKTEAHIKIWGALTTPYFNRRREFFGDLNNQDTIREAIAFIPQSMVADIANRGIRLCHKYLEPKGLRILSNQHDAMTFQVPKGTEKYFSSLVKKCFEVPILMPSGKTMCIKVDPVYAENWMLASL